MSDTPERPASPPFTYRREVPVITEGMIEGCVRCGAPVYEPWTVDRATGIWSRRGQTHDCQLAP